MATLADRVAERWSGPRGQDHRPVEIERYYGLARALANRYAHRGESVEDLQQVAMLALIKAADRYRPEHPASFPSYATACILGEIKRHFRDRTWMMRVPRSLQERFLDVRAARAELMQTQGRAPTIAQIADFLRISEEDVLDAMEAGDSYRPLSLDVGYRQDDEGGVEVGVIDEGFDRSLDHRQLRDSLSTLAPQDRDLIRRIFFEGDTQRSVAQELGVSQMQVSRMVARTIDKLRRSMEAA